MEFKLLSVHPVYNFENEFVVCVTTDIEEQNEEVHEEKVSKLIRIAQNTSRKLDI